MVLTNLNNLFFFAIYLEGLIITLMFKRYTFFHSVSQASD